MRFHFNTIHFWQNEYHWTGGEWYHLATGTESKTGSPTELFQVALANSFSGHPYLFLMKGGERRTCGKKDTSPRTFTRLKLKPLEVYVREKHILTHQSARIMRFSDERRLALVDNRLWEVTDRYASKSDMNFLLFLFRLKFA